MTITQEFLFSFTAILPVVNPFSKPPIFLSITEGCTPEARRKQAIKASLYAFVILVISLMAGSLILAFFSITLPALQIAGGLVIARTGFLMLNPQKEHHQTDHEEAESKELEDVSFVPLALPLLGGPGSMAVMINLSTTSTQWTDWIAVVVACAAVCVLTFFTLVESVRLVAFLGINGMNALSKLMGFLLLSLAVQFIITGVSNAFTHLPHSA